MALPPGFVEDSSPSGGPPPGFSENWNPSLADAIKSSVGKIVDETFMRKGSMSRDLATNPATMAKAIPPIAGVAGAISPIPGGSTIFTVGGRQLSNEALRLLGRKDDIPSAMAQVGEGALAALGDASAIPAIKRNIFGKQIGKAEEAAKVITRAPDRLPTAGNVGEYLNTLESQLDNGTINTAQAAKDAYAGTKYINSNPNLVGKSDEIGVQAARVGAKAQSLLNELVKNRAEPAANMAKAMKIPNALRKGYKAIPQSVKAGLGFGTGTSAVGGATYALWKALGDGR